MKPLSAPWPIHFPRGFPVEICHAPCTEATPLRVLGVSRQSGMSIPLSLVYLMSKVYDRYLTG